MSSLSKPALLPGLLSVQKLSCAVKETLQQWKLLTYQPTILEDLHLFRQIQKRFGLSLQMSNPQDIAQDDDATKKARIGSAAQPNQQRIANLLLYEAIEKLGKINPDEAKLLTDRFMDGLSIRMLATQRNTAESYVYKQINQAIEDLTTSLIAQETECRVKKQETWLGRIAAPSYSNLVGIKQHQQALYDICSNPEAPWLVSVEGIGGIGKTALTHSVVTKMLEGWSFDELCWISAKSNQLSPYGVIGARPTAVTQTHSILYELLRQVAPNTASSSNLSVDQIVGILQSHLRNQRYLIVIDNLETVTDLETLLPHLETIANPSRFVLTSREQTPPIQPIHRFVVPELSEADSLLLIRQEANDSNLVEIAQCADVELLPIYQIVGGNPLALRLVAGLLHTQPLSSVLTSLQNAPTRQADNLYTFIYRESWRNLDDMARQVLLAMPLIQSAGDTLEYLSDITTLLPADLTTAIVLLANLNLVQVHREKLARCYSIHSLTRTFLLNDAISWK